MLNTLDARFPNIARFTREEGVIEIGYRDDFPVTSFIRAVYGGDSAWKGAEEYPSLDAAFGALEEALGRWRVAVGIG